mgnify:CR=1 FL=1
MPLNKFDTNGLRQWLPYGVLLVGLLVTGVEAYRNTLMVESQAKVRFDAAVETTRVWLERRMDRYIDVLRAARALFAASESVTRAEFRNYVGTINVAERYPGLAAIQYTPRETPATLGAFHARLKQDGLGEIKLWSLTGGRNIPLHQAEEYFPIEYIEPFTSLALGFDVAASVNLDAMVRARDTGLPSLASKVPRLVEDPDDQPGFLLFVPVYRNGAAVQTVAERRSALQGYVSGVFHAHDLLRDIYVKQTHPQVDFEVFDGATLNRTTLLFDDDGAAHALDPSFRARFRRTAEMEIAGHLWTLHFATLPEFEQDINQNLPWIVLGGGVTLSLLLFWITRVQVLARARAERVTAKLKESRANLARAQQIGRMGSWEVDLARYEWRWSDELYQLCGLMPATTQPGYQALLDVVHPEDRALVKKYLDAALNAGTSFGIDHRLGANDRRERYVHHHAEVIFDHADKPARVAGTLQDITERKRAESHVQMLYAELEQRVQERTAELAAANQELEAFSYSVSHDLRAPLRSINGFSQALLEDYGAQLDAAALGYLQRVRGASQHMAVLIDDLLELARVTRSELRRERVDLSTLAKEITADLRKTDPERAAEIVITPALSTAGDARLLRVVLTNLFTNAWKFTRRHPQARIEFGALEEDGRVVYFIRDDGAGFNMAYAGKLFSPFQRLHPAAEFEGHGIGLATVQRIISRHGGRVWAEGEVERGATFYFSLGDHTLTGC